MFDLPELGYAYEALEPSISHDIMEIHYTKHHAGYVAKLNEALEKVPSATVAPDTSLADILRNLSALPDDVRTTVRNQGGGHFNHTLFWQVMAPHAGGQPSGDLLEGLVKRYGSFQQFTEAFNAQAASVFGSGWAWLMPDLSIVTTPNQDNPLMSSQVEPLMGLDVWEHAYYLDYKNVRADYIKAWWDVVNWQYIEERFQAH